jgi:putative transposase
MWSARNDGNDTLLERLKDWAGQCCRHGHLMLHHRLRRERRRSVPKRVWRIYRKQELAVRWRQKLPALKQQRLARPDLTLRLWSLDFVISELINGLLVKTPSVASERLHQ